MADWNDFRRSLESQPVHQPPMSALRERRRRRQQRKAIAATFAVVMVGSATGLAVLGETRSRPGKPAAVPTALSQIVNSDRLPPPKDYEDYVVTDVDFVTATSGFALGLRCVGDACDIATWQTADGGETWSDVRPVATRVPRATYQEEDPSGGGARSIRMVDDLNGYAFNPDLYVTRDGGLTWRRLPQRSKVTSVSVAGSSVWVTQRGCPRDTDCDLVVSEGSLGEDALRDLAVPETNAALAIVRRSGERTAFLVAWDAPDGSPAALHVTRDRGRAWTRGEMPCPDARAVSLSARAGAPSWMVCSADGRRSAFVSTDGATTWRRVLDPPVDGVVTDLTGVGADGAYLTTQQPAAIWHWDGGAWRRADVARGYGYGNTDVVDGAVYAMGDAGQLWRRQGDTWRRLALPPAAPKAAAPPPPLGLRDTSVRWTGLSFLDDRVGWAAGAGCDAGTCRAVVRRTTDGGETWTAAGSPGWTEPQAHPDDLPTSWDVAFADERNGWLSGDRLYVTHDGGATWRPVADVPRPATLAVRDGAVWGLAYAGCDDEHCVPVVLHGDAAADTVGGRPMPALGESASLAPDGSDRAFVVGTDEAFATEDGGETWLRRATPPCFPTSIGAASETVWGVCGADEGERQRQVRSTDGGRTWQVSPLPGTGPATGAVVALSDTVAWRAGANRGLVVTRDGGRTWTPSPVVAGKVVTLTFANPSHGWLLSDGALYRTTDGATWERLG